LYVRLIGSYQDLDGGLAELSLSYLSGGVEKYYVPLEIDGCTKYKCKDDKCFSSRNTLGDGIKLVGNVLVFDHYIMFKIIEIALERKFVVNCAFNRV
jgi:hypothetical protein